MANQADTRLLESLANLNLANHGQVQIQKRPLPPASSRNPPPPPPPYNYGKLNNSLNGGSPRINPAPITNGSSPRINPGPVTNNPSQSRNGANQADTRLLESLANLNPSQSRNGANPGAIINNQQQQQQRRTPQPEMKLNCVLRDGLGASLNGGSPRITPVPFTNNPSQSRNGANPGTMINNQQQQQQQPEMKLKLPYNVKLSKVTGTSEAEKKLELLTRQLEKEMDEKEKQEYFGDCVACGKEVIGGGKACKAMDKIYHSACFVCNSCGRSLREKAFYNVNGRIYCEEDYLYSGFQQTSEKCAFCGHLIMEMILQAMGQFYHPGCFRCCMCNECLDGVPFTVDFDNKIYCVNDFHRIFAPVCNICNTSITPVEGTDETVRVVAMEKDFHVDCYVCESCNMQLTDEPEKRCYPLGDHLYCRSCHIRQGEKLGYASSDSGYGVSMKTFRDTH